MGKAEADAIVMRCAISYVLSRPLRHWIRREMSCLLLMPVNT